MPRFGRRACRSTRCRSLRAKPRGPLEICGRGGARMAAYPCEYPSRKDGVQKSMESISGRCRTPSNWSRNTACLRVITSGFCAQIRGTPLGEWSGTAAPAPAPAPRSAARRRQRTLVDGFLPEKTPKTRDFTLAKPGKNVQEVVEIAWVSLVTLYCQESLLVFFFPRRHPPSFPTTSLRPERAASGRCLRGCCLSRARVRLSPAFPRRFPRPRAAASPRVPGASLG